MATADRIEVLPGGDDEWLVRHGDKEPKSFKSRTKAIESALKSRKTESVVLLRANGSVHGELHHATPSRTPDGQVAEGGKAGEGAGN